MPTCPSEPEREWLNSFLEPGLTSAKGYHIDRANVAMKLDQNELPFDWPKEFKRKVMEQVINLPWNRYPEPYYLRLEALIAEDCGVLSENIVLAPGSNYHITTVLTMLTQKLKGKLVIARPSFSLYEEFCRVSGIAYETWQLRDFEYCVEDLPELPAGSVVMFASPNNPVGNMLDYKVLAELLEAHPKTYFVADEAYYEFLPHSFVPLLERFSNLIILRTFSKARAAAGLRLGYTIASKAFIQELRKLTHPYILNPFVATAITLFLEDDEREQDFQKNIVFVNKERQRIFQNIRELSSFRVIPSCANFLLLQFPSIDLAEEAYGFLVEHSILFRNMARSPGLEGCIRMSVGTTKENDEVIRVLTQWDFRKTSV